MDLKKVFSIAIVAGTLFSGSTIVSADNENIPTARCGGEHAPLYGKYPMVGANEASAFYLDQSSCYYTIDGNVATLGCLVYGTGGGVAPSGGPGSLTQYTFTFQTYKKNGKRKVVLCKAVSKGRTGVTRDCTDSMIKYDDGFLMNMFWMVANTTGLKASLD
ncbi:MAG: hypothetical protein KBI24_04525 [Selenomonas sp.]|nr:hypothetical protein [Selenomonas sp.]